MIKTAILNFSEIYERESFYLNDKGSCSFAPETNTDYDPAGTVHNSISEADPDTHKSELCCLDLRDLQGTNCMCDDAAKEIILERLSTEVLSDSHMHPECFSGEKTGRLPRAYLPMGLHFIDSGNYHYVSALFTSFIKEPFSLVVLDHHPDMQAPMFDILSCGGWILDVIKNNPYVRDVHIIGADRNLISQLPDEDREMVKFYSLEDIFLEGAESSQENLIKDTDLRPAEPVINLPETSHPIYLSIDKDVMARDELVTNWDQGDATTFQVLSFIKEIISQKTESGIIGIDICGECAPDQEDCNLSEAIRGNDDFNSSALEAVLCGYNYYVH